jgi:alpha-tubulin suppressor-like RCC1 family protein
MEVWFIAYITFVKNTIKKHFVIFLTVFLCFNSSNTLYSQKQIWTWGSNNRWQLGDGGIAAATNLPIQITNSFVWTKVVSGNSFSVALKSDGTLWGWGWNDYGNFGDATNLGKATPTQIGSGTDWSDVVVGGLHILALKSNGTIWSSGVNTNGQLGDGTYLDKNTLTQIGVANNWVFISAGANDIHVIKSNGTLWGCGLNGNGSLGDGTNLTKNVLTQLGTDTDWEFVASGSEHTLAIKSNGTLWGCGFNTVGPLGDEAIVEIHLLKLELITIGNLLKQVISFLLQLKLMELFGQLVQIPKVSLEMELILATMHSPKSVVIMIG